MSPEIMGSQMNPNDLPCLVHNSPARSVGYGKDPLIFTNLFGITVFPETISHLLGDEHNLPFLTTRRQGGEE
jgi:hypothetical protein